MLGVQLDLREAKLGLALVSNIWERVEELTSDIEAVPKSRQLSKKDGEKLRGRLEFADRQLLCVAA